MILTIYGEMDEALLEKREGVVDNAHECTRWIEYWLNGELVHRSVHIQLKKGPDLGALLADLGGE